MFKIGDRVRIKKEFEKDYGGPDRGTIVRKNADYEPEDDLWWVKWDSSGEEPHIPQDEIELIPESMTEEAAVTLLLSLGYMVKKG